MLQCCLNGDRSREAHSAIPCTPEEIAAAAGAAVSAGATELHIHPRDARGLETLAADAVAACLTAVRARVPGVPVGLSTQWAIPPGGGGRLEPVHHWQVLPDYVSVNLSEPDAPQVIALMLERGIGIEAGLFTPADVGRFLALPDAGRCLRILVELVTPDMMAAPDRALDSAAAMLARLAAAATGLPVLLHGADGSAWPVLREAAGRGLDSRIGFEDVLTLPDGSVARDNAALVAAATPLFRRA